MCPSWTSSPLGLRTIETGGGGDCLFHAFAQALEVWMKQPVHMHNVRDDLANSLTEANGRHFISQVREDHRIFLPAGAVDWNRLRFHRDDTKAVRQARMLVREEGMSFQGTDVVLRQLLAYSPFLRHSRIGCVATSSWGPGFTDIFPSFAEDPQEWYILLYCTNNAHWQAATIDVGVLHGGRLGVLSTAALACVLPQL